MIRLFPRLELAAEPGFFGLRFHDFPFQVAPAAAAQAAPSVRIRPPGRRGRAAGPAAVIGTVGRHPGRIGASRRIGIKGKGLADNGIVHVVAPFIGERLVVRAVEVVL